MEVRTGFMIALGVTVLIATAFLVWQAMQPRPARIGEQHFYELAKNINKTCKSPNDKSTTQMVYLPQSFPGEEENIWWVKFVKKTIPGRAGDPRIQIYYENFPKGYGLGTSMLSMGWREDVPWTRDFTGFMATATIGEFGGEFVAPLALKGVGSLGKKAAEIPQKAFDAVTPSGISADAVAENVVRLGREFAEKTGANIPFRIAGYMVKFLDEARYALARGARAAARGIRIAIRKADDVTPGQFFADGGVVKRVMSSDEMGNFLGEFIEGKKKSYDEIFDILKREGLADRVEEGAEWELTKEGRAILGRVENLAEEQGTSFRYYDFLARKGNWKDKLTARFEKWLSKRYTTFLPPRVQREVGRSMLELDDTMRVKVMRQLYKADAAAKGVDTGPWGKTKYLFQEADVHFRFGKQWEETLENYLSRRSVVKESLQEMRNIKLDLGDVDVSGKSKGKIFNLAKKDFLSKLDSEGFNPRKIVGRDYLDYLNSKDAFSQKLFDEWSDGIENLNSRINHGDILEAMTDKNKGKVVNLIRNGNLEKANDIMASQYRQNLVYDLMYSRFMDDFAGVVASKSSMVAVPENSVGSMLLKIDNAFTESGLEVVERGGETEYIEGVIDELTRKLTREGDEEIITKLPEDVVERNVKRYVTLKQISHQCYVEEGVIKNWDEAYNKYPAVKKRLDELVKTNFKAEKVDEEFQNLKDILQSVEKETLLREEIGKKGESLGNGIWRLWMLETSENYDEAKKFMRMAKGKSITLDPKAPATYGFLRASSFLGEGADRSISSKYNCNKNELCMQMGAKTYSFKIDKSCDVILNRKVPGYASLSNPKFYLVSPCYSKVKIERRPYKTGITSQYIDWKAPIEDGDKKHLSNNVMLESGKIKNKNTDKEINDPIEINKEDKGESIHSYNIILKDDKKRGNYTTPVITLPEPEEKDKGYTSHLNGKVSVDIEDHDACMYLEILKRNKKEIAQYGNCKNYDDPDNDDKGISLCNGTFDFNVSKTGSELPKEFRVRFHFFRKNTEVDTPKLIDFTVNRWKGKKNAVVITPQLCSNKEKTKNEIVDNIIGETKYGQDKRAGLFEKREYPNYCYASTRMVSRYMGKEYAAAAVSMAGAIPGVGNLIAVTGGLTIQALGESFVVWPYAYERERGLIVEKVPWHRTGVPRKEGESCPMKNN